jgi:hypothetical protein
MSYITITEFEHLARDTNHLALPAPMSISVAEQSIDLGLTATPSEPFKGKFICIFSPVTIALAFGAKPEANPKYHVRPPGTHYYGVNPGERLSVIMVEP